MRPLKVSLCLPRPLLLLLVSLLCVFLPLEWDPQMSLALGGGKSWDCSDGGIVALLQFWVRSSLFEIFPPSTSSSIICWGSQRKSEFLRAKSTSYTHSRCIYLSGKTRLKARRVMGPGMAEHIASVFLWHCPPVHGKGWLARLCYRLGVSLCFPAFPFSCSLFHTAHHLSSSLKCMLGTRCNLSTGTHWEL